MNADNKLILKENNKRHMLYLILYVVLFYAAWTIKEAYVTRAIMENGSIDINLRYVLLGCIKLLLWVVPVFMYIVCLDKEKPAGYLKIDRNVTRGLLWGVAICVVYIGSSMIKGHFSGKLSVNLDMGLDKWLNTVLIAGFAEEIVFRGFLLQKLEACLNSCFEILTGKMKPLAGIIKDNKEAVVFWTANVLTSLLFIFIHFPRWHFEGEGILFSSMISVFILGIAFGYTYKKTGSIWASVIFHSTNNFIVSAIISAS